MALAKIIARNVSPLHTHDCDACKFLGSVDGRDLYFCSRERSGVVRYSSRPECYGSLQYGFGLPIPKGSPYALIAAIIARGIGFPCSYSAGLPPVAIDDEDYVPRGFLCDA